MYPSFDVQGLVLEKLLHQWKWLVHGEYSLLAVNAFGDLYLESVSGSVHRLDVTRATLSEVAASAKDFAKAIHDPGKKREWLLEDLARQAAERGCSPGKGQCVGYKIPLVFKESANAANNSYVADLYEFVSFMGDLHGQMKEFPDGGRVRTKIQPKPDSAG